MNFYKHHLGDYDGATSHLSWDEDMAYIRLMRVYYRTEKPIRHTERYRLVRAVSKAHQAAVDRILAEFFTKTKGLWHNKRCEEEIAAYQDQVVINRRIARERTVHASSTLRPRNVDLTTNQIPEPLTTNQNQILKTDLGLSISPTRERKINVKTILKKTSEQQKQEDQAIERNRRIAVAIKNNNVELAKAIKAGKA